MKPEWEWLTKTIYDPAIFWVMVTAIATIALVVVTIFLVVVGAIPLVRARRAQLAEEFRAELLTPSARKIFFLASHGFLEFKVDDTTKRGFFMIIEPQENIIKQRLEQIFDEQRIVLTFEMDDEFLQPLEELAHYEENKVVDFKDVYRMFADYVDVAMSNSAIRQYITWLRGVAGWRVYSNLERLHAKLKAHKEILDKNLA